MIPELLQSSYKVRRKKFRGQSRYFRKVLRTAKNFSLTPTAEDWWDNWHYHADWPGWGNVKWSYRLGHFKALAKVFDTIAKARDLFPAPFQCWILISGRSAGEDSVFLHTPNANGTSFPFQPKGVYWNDDRLLPVFTALLPEYDLRIGHVRRFDKDAWPARYTSTFFIYSPEVGIMLE
jgi:hypothetical protein